MSVEVLQSLSLISFVIAGALFLLAIVLFFTMHIPALFGEVSGRTAKKAIQKRRWNGIDSEAKPNAQLVLNGKLHQTAAPATQESPQQTEEHKPRVPLIAENPKEPLKKAPTLTEESNIPVPKKEPAVEANPQTNPVTSKMNEVSNGETSVLPKRTTAETAVLQLGQTSLLSQNDEGITTVLQSAGQTCLLSPNRLGETSLLQSNSGSEVGTTGALPPLNETTVLASGANIALAKAQAAECFCLVYELSYTESTEIIE